MSSNNIEKDVFPGNSKLRQKIFFEAGWCLWMGSSFVDGEI